MQTFDFSSALVVYCCCKDTLPPMFNRVLNPARNDMFKVNNRDTRRCEIRSKLTTKTP